MGYFCSGCNINWSRLHNQDCDTNGETYEFCPKCWNDLNITFNETDTKDLMWMPAFGTEPIPVAFTSRKEYNTCLHKKLLEDNGITQEQYEEMKRENTRRHEQQLREEHQRMIEQQEEHYNNRIKKEDAAIEAYVKQFNST
jgi:hypothetical protein